MGHKEQRHRGACVAVLFVTTALLAGCHSDSPQAQTADSPAPPPPTQQQQAAMAQQGQQAAAQRQQGEAAAAQHGASPTPGQ